MQPKKNEYQGYDPLTDGPELSRPIPEPEEKQVNTSETPLKGSDYLGFQKPLKRMITGVVTLALLIGVAVIFKLFNGNQSNLLANQAATLTPVIPAITLSADLPDPASVVEIAYNSSIPRLAQLHTILPSRPRNQVTKYTVVQGDTVFGIAQKFGLAPETILWGNYFTLLDNPTLLQPGQVLNILPVDGVYHRWSAGEGLNSVAAYYHVSPEDIVDFPGNNLNRDTIGDYANPNIAPDTWLIVPGGQREFIDWSMPNVSSYATGGTSDSVATSCGYVKGGAVGLGYFVWPTNHHFLSGYDYSPEINHYGIDLDGETGDPIYASDSGVIVFAGWNDYGYGNEILIDHGNGWKTLYAHLSQFYVQCGESVGQGQTIAAMGSTGHSTGSHLHFEMISDEHGKVNPHSFLPAP